MQDIFAHIAMYGIFTGLLWFPVLLALTLLTPKKLLNKYFKKPHFNAGEFIVFGSFPGFLIRTSIFCRFYLTPKAVKGRKLEDFVEDSPKWYRVSVILISLGFLTHGAIVCSSTALALLLR